MPKTVGFFFCLLLSGSFSITDLLANDLPEVIPSDVTLKVGGAVGTLTKTRKISRKEENYDVGGAAFTAAFLTDGSNTLSTLYQFQMIYDFANDQILRKGVDIGFNWHFLGGGFAVQRRYPFASEYGVSDYAVSLLARLGWHSYTAISKQEGAVELTGSAVESKMGLGYRTRVGQQSDFSMELIRTLTSLPWDDKQIRAELTELHFVGRVIF